MIFFSLFFPSSFNTKNNKLSGVKKGRLRSCKPLFDVKTFGTLLQTQSQYGADLNKYKANQVKIIFNSIKLKNRRTEWYHLFKLLMPKILLFDSLCMELQHLKEIRLNRTTKKTYSAYFWLIQKSMLILIISHMF